MFRRFLPILFVASITLFGLSQREVGHASPSATTVSGPNQTFPSRTPTPGPPTPTATKKSGGGDPTAVPPTTVPTSTDIPQPTATATIAVTLAFTPVNGFMPTAEACSDRPTVQAINPTNVRLGPSADYDIVTQLTYLEVRHIIGRAADDAWWQILLPDGQSGWVADNVVVVSGYIGNVPITDGSVPASWNPTPNPLCTVTPTPEATETTIPATATTETALSPTAVTPAAEASTTPETAVAANNSETTDSVAAAPQPTQTAVSRPTLAPTSPPAISQAPANGEEPAPQDNSNRGSETAVIALNDFPTRSAADFLLPVVAVLLLAAGFVAVFARRKSKRI